MSIFKINDVFVSAPIRGMSIKRVPQIKTFTNAHGRLLVQQINSRSAININNLTWSYLESEEWEKILSELSKTTGTITFYDAERKKYVTVDVIFSDIKETPYLYDEENKIIIYSSCSCTVTDMMQEITEVDSLV